MDIAAMSVVMNQAQVKQQASISVLKKAMGTADQNGNAIMKMMQTPIGEHVAHPHLGKSVDVKA